MNRVQAIHELRLWIGTVCVVGTIVYVAALVWVNRPHRRRWHETRRTR